MKRIDELDFARVVAMLSVIAIHVTSTFMNYHSNFLIFGMNLAFILNQATRFAVPLFILLSGMSLGLNDTNDSYVQFLKNRVIKIGVPYLFWFSVYFIYQNYANLSAVDLGFFIRSLLLGQAAPHLYFIVIIFQLYLLYPLLKRCVDQAPYKSIFISFIITYGIQMQFFFLKYELYLIPNFIRPYLWLLFPTWLFYFVVGLVFTKARLSQIQKITSQNALSILFATAVFACFYVMESNVTQSLDAIKPSLNLYVILMLLASFSLWKYVGRVRIFQRATRFLSKHSMTIYFEHVLVLCFFRRFVIFTQGMAGMLLLYASVLICSVVIAGIIEGLPHALTGRAAAHKVKVNERDVE